MEEGEIPSSMGITQSVGARPLAWVLLCSGRHTPLLVGDPLPLSYQCSPPPDYQHEDNFHDKSYFMDRDGCFPWTFVWRNERTCYGTNSHVFRVKEVRKQRRSLTQFSLIPPQATLGNPQWEPEFLRTFSS